LRIILECQELHTAKEISRTLNLHFRNTLGILKELSKYKKKKRNVHIITTNIVGTKLIKKLSYDIKVHFRPNMPSKSIKSIFSHSILTILKDQRQKQGSATTKPYRLLMRIAMEPFESFENNSRSDS
jgi:hypothetical protein